MQRIHASTFLKRLPKFPEFCEFALVGVAFGFGQMTPTSYSQGLMMISLGVFLTIWSAGHSHPGRAEGGELSGPWRFVRHPEVVARFLIIFGAILAARAAWVFGCAIVLLGVQYKELVKQGERELSRWLGPTFSMYRLFVPSFLPQFLPARLPQFSLRSNVQAMPWSLRRFLRRRKVLAKLCFVVVTVLCLGLGLYWDVNQWWYRSLGLILVVHGIATVWQSVAARGRMTAATRII